jgi:hypothetical protein
MSNISAISWREQVTFGEVMMFALYSTNPLGWIFIVLADNCPWIAGRFRHFGSLAPTTNIWLSNLLILDKG